MENQKKIDSNPFVNDLGQSSAGMPNPPSPPTGPFKIEGTFHFVGAENQPMQTPPAAPQQPTVFKAPPQTAQQTTSQQPVGADQVQRLSIRHGIEEVKGATKQKVQGAKGAVKEAKLGSIWASPIFLALCKWFWILPAIMVIACFRVFYLPLIALLMSLGAMLCMKKGKTRIARILTLCSIGICAMTPVLNLIVSAVTSK